MFSVLLVPIWSSERDKQGIFLFSKLITLSYSLIKRYANCCCQKVKWLPHRCSQTLISDMLLLGSRKNLPSYPALSQWHFHEYSTGGGKSSRILLSHSPLSRSSDAEEKMSARNHVAVFISPHSQNRTTKNRRMRECDGRWRVHRWKGLGTTRTFYKDKTVRNTAKRWRLCAFEIYI